jgi:hypothetical protein
MDRAVWCARRTVPWLVALLVASPVGAQSYRLSELGSGPVPIPGVGNAELSGITWVGGTRYLAVDDGRPRLFPLDVTLDEASGKIASVVAGDFVTLKGADDNEGIAWLAKTGTVLVSDEEGQLIREYDPSTGEVLRSVPPPPLFRGRLSKNTGFESMAVTPDGESVWTGNEGPLRLDGAGPTALEGAWLRLQRLDANLAPTGQWAYRSEPGLGFVGLVDLLVAPGGELISLERALTGGGFSARIFELDLHRATDVSGFEKLRNRSDFWPVRKTKLWERTSGFQNFEGLTLGPELPSGGRLVLLISDGGDQRPPTLLALRLLPNASGPAEAAARPVR